MQDRYRVVTGPPLSPSSVSAEELEGLADALNALTHPAVTALNDLTVNAVELAFNSLSPRDRQDLLGSLGIRIAAPRRASKALCADVLGRLQREARQHTCTCGVKGLTHIVMNQVGRFVFAQDGEAVSDPVSRWGEPLVRATVFAWSNASVGDAHVLAWAADQDWFAGAADDDEAARFAAVGDVARSIVAAYPGFEPGVSEERETPPDPVSDDESGKAAEGTRADGLAELDVVCRELESALVRARETSEKVTALVADGCPPQDEDLAPLTVLGDTFDRAEAVFRAAGIVGVPRRLEDMTRAASAYRVTHEHDVRARENLRELLDVVCRPDSPAAAATEAVRDVTRRLLDAPVWEQRQRDESAALVALTRLIRLGRQADAAAEILVLQEQVARVLPACAMAAVMAPELELAQPEAGATEPDVAQNAADVTAAALTQEPAPAPEPEAPTAAPAVAGPLGADDAPAPTPAVGSPAPPTPSAAEVTPEPVQVPTPELAPTAATSANEDKAGEDEATVEDVTERALVRLVVERRFGLAHHVARAGDHPESQVAALRLAGAAALLTSGDSQGARLTTDLLQSYGGYAGRDTEWGELLLLPALLRTALITGDHLAGAQLKALVPRLPDRLGEMATAVADRALSGALFASPLVVIADDAERDARLRELREQCNALLTPQRLRFARATEIAKRWLNPDDGLLGSLLMTVVHDRRDAIQQVREQTERLSKLAEVNNEIDRMDRKHRSPSGKPLQGAGRQDLVHLVERAVGLAKEWCLVVDGTRRGDRSDRNRAVQEISSLRQSLLDAREAVLGELERLARRSGALAAATAWAARASMEELFALLTGDTATMRAGGSLAPERVLDVELLKVCDTLDERPSLDQLLMAVDRSWQEALTERLDHDAFAAARTIVELAGRGMLPAAQAKEFTPPQFAEIEEREAVRRTELRKAHDELVAELHRAQADGAVTDDQDLRLQELLADARERLDGADTHDLVAVRRGLDTVRSSLPDFRREAADRIRARLDVLDSTPDQRAQVLRRLETNDLATAADLVYFLEIGEDVPEIENGESYLAEFFPAVPDGLRGGIDRGLVDLVRSCGTHPAIPVLDYSALSTDEAALAADALDEWRLMGTTEPKDRLHVAYTRRVPPLLKLLGYDAKSARPLDERSQHRREYRLFEATEVAINGRAKAPAFGSQIREQGGNLRVMLVWGRPPAKVVMSWAERDTSGTGLLVVYFGTLSREARVELAVGSGRLSQPLLVVDDAALAYLAAHGNRQVSTATQILLPFSGVNPYIREKRGRIGSEMFYGRDAERKSILDPRGTQVIFGGRGLGKSALLADAGDRFMEQRPGYYQTVYVNLDQENIGKGSSLGPEALWSVLDRKLTEAQVLNRPQGRRPAKDISERVRAGIQAWTEGDSRRRLLILLDECDQFFEADAPRFNQTKKLKGLGDDTKDRAKVVFAGLHSVQRFSKLASNGPFGHLAQTPKVIGPLAPQFAAELLVEPMRALGFEFLDLDLVNRVLGYCSYQPFLLQMFGHRLVEVMHRKRARRGPEGPKEPPYAVELADIEVVESDTGLRDSISAAFKDTLSLDHRYDVIANVLAYHARHRGLEVRLSDTELREECETYWRKGFEQLDTEGFRAYLSEMVGLGILAPNHDGLGWHLRGPSALRMIGGSHEVEARLLRAEQDCELQESIVQEGRPELPDGRPAPLTITQLDDLLGERTNQTRVVLGTAATGVTDVGDTLRRVAGRIADWKLPPVGNARVYRQELTGGVPRERRVVISDFANYPARPEACREAVDQAETQLPGTPGVTRAVVLVTDPTQLALWQPLLTGTEPTKAAPVVLRRHDRRSLRGWAQRVEMFHTEDRLDRLHELTGGWPLLVDRAHRLHGELGDPDEVLRRLAGLRTDRAEARSFAEATGLYTDPMLATGYQALAAEFKEDLFDLESAVTAVAMTAARIEDEDEARWIVTCLDALQVFDREHGQLRLEPLLRECVALHA
ncbi:hypothetical protein [Streptomyces griseorubiginosus]|uniref:hypothetical protein n=1 Tax=Streptomyces griseorubiginosus TaxID=67304 RepID=UPI002E803F16|nr:hypothetical protein [Streptomyces griseorubiginosus]WUB47510.1 hypothetical protein OHN19_30920 [Streptomyces griseorubiginosus]WUB56035.1 hypothetical protein OG942_30930 [Streptomyces griseorubiginosus]